MRQFTLVSVLMLIVAAAGIGAATAQGEPDAAANYSLNVRGGPGFEHAVIGVLHPGTGLVLEARNADTSWVLGHTEDGAYRGWVAALYLRYRDGFMAARLPESSEVIAAAAAQAVMPSAVSTGSAYPVSVESLESAPVIPVLPAQVRAIFARGQELGNNAHVFAKVGDCNMETRGFLALAGEGQIEFGGYGYLQHTVAFFSEVPAGTENPFTRQSFAAHAGLTVLSVSDPAWGDPARCPGGLSLLECEYAIMQPSVALILLGLNDAHFLSVAEYEQGLRRIIAISLERGVVPVLATSPTWADESDRAMLAKRLAFNATVLRLGAEYQVPVINLWRAAQDLPMSGLEGDLLHMAFPPTSTIYLDGDQQSWGLVQWNLLVLQTLDVLRGQVLAG